MARIRVGSGRFRVGFRDALHKAVAGDVLVVSEGDYAVGNIFLLNLHIVGDGDPRKIIIRGQVEVRGSCQISNVTICAPHFGNAITIKAPGGRVELDGCDVYGDPTWKYPAVFNRGGTVVMRRTSVHYIKTSTGVLITDNGALHAVDSGVALLAVSGSRAALTNVTAFAITSRERGRVDATGRLDLIPEEGQRSLTISGESVCSVEALRAMAGSRTGLCDESVLRIGRVEVPENETFIVVTNGRALVETSSPAVRIVGTAEPEPSLAYEPGVVPWRLEDAHAFATAVTPLLKLGDTVQLEEGEYFLDDYDHVLSLGVDLIGGGEADKTVLNGTLVVMEGANIAVSNLTVRPVDGNNALSMQYGGSVSLTNVVFECPAGSTVPAIYIGSGTATMTGCHVVASTESEVGRVDIDKGAHLDATDSALGWLGLWGQSTAALSDCQSVRIRVQDGSRVTSVGEHFVEANSCSLRQVLAEGGSVVEFEEITTDASDFEAYASASALTVASLTLPDHGSAVIHVADNAEVSVMGERVTIIDLNTVPEEPEEPEEPDGPEGPEGPEDSDDAVVSPADRADSGADSGADSQDALAEIMSLTGLVTVKEQIQKFTRMVRFNGLRQQQGLKSTDLTMHSMFLGNPGTGKTTVARLLGKALFSAGAIERDGFVEVGRRALVGEHLGASANMTQKVLEEARGGVLFIDEAYSLYQENNNEFAQEAVDTLITFMENNRDEIVIIFAGYTDKMQDLLNMNPGLKSRVPNRFDFEDYSSADIADIGYRNLVDGDYTVDKALYHRVVAEKYGRSTDKSNGRWIRNFNQDLVNEMVQRVLSDDAPTPDDLTHITADDVYKLIGGDSEQKGTSIDMLLEELDGLVGLAPVKDWVRKLVNRVRVDQQRLELGGTASRPTYHMVFAGNPGTGKTTVAKIIAQLFFNLGILENSTVKEVNRTSLVGSYIGHTEAKTSKAIEEAMGGVIFVDEAYQLHIEGSQNDFGTQAIETFMTSLENDRDKFVAIFAGYTENMERFLSVNPGLRSRIPLSIEFPDFSPDEVGKIVVAHLAKGWTFDEALVAAAAASAYEALEPQDRSNGRWARTFAERLEAEQIEYVASNGIGGSDMKRIPAEVVESLLLPRG